MDRPQLGSQGKRHYGSEEGSSRLPVAPEDERAKLDTECFAIAGPRALALFGSGDLHDLDGGADRSGASGPWGL